MISTGISEVRLTPQAITGMLRATLEPMRLVESIGGIYGKNRNGILSVSDVFTYTQTQRKPLSVESIPNFSLPRLNSLEEALKKFNNGQIRLGEYHSHICNERIIRKDNLLSEADLLDKEEALKNFESEEWIEIILRIKKLSSYKGDEEPGISFVNRKNMLEYRLHTNTKRHLLFKGVFIGYAFSLKDNYDDLKDKYPQDKQVPKRLSVREVKVRLKG